MANILITGATRGLGLQTARAVGARGGRVLCAGRDERRVHAVADLIAAEPIVLDLGRLDDVRRVVRELPHVHAVACNAGLQILREPTVTPDGFEETFQVNHLAHVALVDALLARPVPPRRVVFVGSATHDPAIRTGTPDPSDDTPAALARATNDAESPRTAGLRRYTTSKLLAIATTMALARQRPDVRFACFDPGLMPGTGLARQYPAPIRLLWATALRGLRVLPFASSATTSGRAFASLLCDEPPPAASGAYVDYRLRQIAPSRRAVDTTYQDAVLRESRELLGASGKPDCW